MKKFSQTKGVVKRLPLILNREERHEASAYRRRWMQGSAAQGSLEVGGEEGQVVSKTQKRVPDDPLRKVWDSQVGFGSPSSQ